MSTRKFRKHTSLTYIENLRPDMQVVNAETGEVKTVVGVLITASHKVVGYEDGTIRPYPADSKVALPVKRGKRAA